MTAPGPPRTGVVTSRRLEVLDRYRVPHRVAAVTDLGRRWRPTIAGQSLEGLSWEDGRDVERPTLWFPSFVEDRPHPPEVLAPALYRLGAAPVFGALLSDGMIAEALRHLPMRWSRGEEIVDGIGERAASVWHAEDGSVILPFDPEQVVRVILREQYVDLMGGSSTQARRLLVKAYYAVRPLLPRPVQIALRRGYRHAQQRSRFPAWPVEAGLHQLMEVLLHLVARVADEPLPYLAPWPEPHRWALVLTHDVETSQGCRRVAELQGIEKDLGFVSSWNFVPGRYALPDELRAHLVAEGCEVGVHGLQHDGHDLTRLAERLPAIAAAAASWGATGFRFPATHRHWDAMPSLPFDYDSSVPDGDPFEPQQGGCCSWLPFFNEGLVELPITLTQDHTLFAILRSPDERLWVEKMDVLSEHGGMALLITHPDYLDGTPLSGAYRSLLTRCNERADVWRALPRDVSAWWRRRAASVPVRTSQGWSVAGPGAGQARLCFVPRRGPAGAGRG